MGGYELGYGSDLDMVFLHGSESNNLMTEGKETKGEKPIAVPVFFARLGQRIIHLLSAHTISTDSSELGFDPILHLAVLPFQ